MTTKKDIGLAIKILRKKAGIKTQGDLGKKINPQPLSKEMINRIENGNGNYGINSLFKIAEVLDCDIMDFFEEKSIALAINKANLEALRHLLKLFEGRIESYEKELK